ncbi:hypothetical protein TNCV_3636301 [Trichonephila clavipes]|nr:hypothetical protein TNCV_3636301 [Trichonephila clavipes]
MRGGKTMETKFPPLPCIHRNNSTGTPAVCGHQFVVIFPNFFGLHLSVSKSEFGGSAVSKHIPTILIHFSLFNHKSHC